MDAKVERELLRKLKKFHGKVPVSQLPSKIGVPKSVLIYLMGKADIPLGRERIQYITKVRWLRTKEGGSAPQLRVSRIIVRQMGLKEGSKVQWFLEKGKIVGIPLPTEESLSGETGG
ncbi:MAG: hypothetical protein JRD89_18750 [Deltaproteobacteria bacterium]|nr:hypothetical protein [Deltaproteobacteria bacterium]